MAALTPDGESTSWLQQKQNVARIFDEFLRQDSFGLATDWGLLSASVLCDKPVYERFSHYLVHVYLIPAGVKNAGLPLACQSVLNYLGSALNRAAMDPGVLFLSGVEVEQRRGEVVAEDEKEDRQGVKVTFERAVKQGEQLDNSESEPLPARPTPCVSLTAPVPVCLRSPTVPRGCAAASALVCARRHRQGRGEEVRPPHAPARRRSVE